MSERWIDAATVQDCASEVSEALLWSEAMWRADEPALVLGQACTHGVRILDRDWLTMTVLVQHGDNHEHAAHIEIRPGALDEWLTVVHAHESRERVGCESDALRGQGGTDGRNRVETPASPHPEAMP